MRLAEFQASGRTYLIAEIAQAHDGSVGILFSLLEAAARAGVDAVKFQVHIADAESSVHEPFRVRFSHVDATRFDYWKRMEMPFDLWVKIKERCDSLGVEFLATPFSNAAVDMLEALGVVRYKVGSGDLANPLLLEKIARTGKEVIISTGLGTIGELDQAVAQFKSHGVPFAILQCTTKYPVQPSEIGLAWMQKLSNRYSCPVGLSDHSGTIYAGLGAVALGATVIETHVTFDRRMFGPDAPASLTVDELAAMVSGARFLEKARGDGLGKEVSEEKQVLRVMFGKALAVNRPMAAGQILEFECLEGKKPTSAGVPVAELGWVLGKRLARDLAKWEFLQRDDLV
jgi:N,N'-diacetyllegionaminate synthase